MSDKRIGQVEGIIYKIEDGNILYLMLKRNPEKGGFWQPVTGGIEPGETPEIALPREIFEELGIKNLKKIIDLEFTFSLEGVRLGQLEYTFGVEVSNAEPITLSWEHTEYKWLPFKQAKEILKWENNKKALEILNSKLTK